MSVMEMNPPYTCLVDFLFKSGHDAIKKRRKKGKSVESAESSRRVRTTLKTYTYAL